MRAIARREDGKLRQAIEIREAHHRGRRAEGPWRRGLGAEPQELLAASLARCTAITMEMYAQRKGWDIGDVPWTWTTSPPSAARPPASR